MLLPACPYASALRVGGGLARLALNAVERSQSRATPGRLRERFLRVAASDDVQQSGVGPDLASAPHFGASMPPQKHEARVIEPATNASGLARWQRKRLETAYQAGKRSISVKQLAGDTKLDRKQVLAWLKERAQQPDMPAERDIANIETADQPVTHKEKPTSAEPPTTTARQSFAERQAEPGGDFARKRMKRSTEMTLEKVFDRYRWPPDDVIAGICTLHREMSPGRVKLWFEEQRRLHMRPQPVSHRQRSQQ